MAHDNTDIIFAQTRFDYRNPENGYGSYHDFWRLVDLSNFPTCYIDEMDIDDPSKCYIFAPQNGEVHHVKEDGNDWFIDWKDAKAKIIFWNLEQSDYPRVPGVSEVWVSDKAFADLIGARYVLMGSHPGLMNYPPVERTGRYDVIMLSYMTNRRLQMAKWLGEKGLSIAPNGWYEKRHKTLMQSRVMLHVHQNDKAYVAPQRWALAAAYRLPVFSEVLDDSGDMGNFYTITSQYYEVPQALSVSLESNGVLRYHGDALHQFLCFDRPFAREVMRNV
jgi:hypothetical protein